MKRIRFAVIALALIFVLAGCNSSDSEPSAEDTATEAPAATETPGAEEAPEESEEPPEETEEADVEPIKIGHICDLTGVEALTGDEARRALDFAVEAIGGEIAGRPIEVIVGDSQSSAQAAVDVAVKMVEQDGVVAIFGPTQAGHKSAVAEYVASVGIPLFLYNGSPSGLLQSNDWLVGAGGAMTQMPTVMADYIYNELGYRTVHTIAMDNSGGWGYIEPFIETFTELGGTVLSQQWTPVPTSEFAPYLVTLEEADALVAWTSGSDAIALWRAWYEMGINEDMPIVAAFHGGFTDYFIPEALEDVDPDIAQAMLGTYAPMMYALDSEDPANLSFVESWTGEFGTVPTGSNLPGACYQAILLLQAAIEANDGDTDPDKLIEAIFAADVTGPEGHLFFDDSHAATKDVYVMQVVQLEDGSYNYSMVKKYEDVPPTGILG